MKKRIAKTLDDCAGYFFLFSLGISTDALVASAVSFFLVQIAPKEYILAGASILMITIIKFMGSIIEKAHSYGYELFFLGMVFYSLGISFLIDKGVIDPFTAKEHLRVFTVCLLFDLAMVAYLLDRELRLFLK